MAAAWTTLSVLDGAGATKTIRAWDESGLGTGPFSFGSVITNGSTGGTLISTAAPLSVRVGDGTTNQTIDVGGATRVTLYSTASSAVVFNNNGRATPGNSAPVVMASQISQLVSSSTSAVALTATSSGAVGDWLDGFLVTPASTGTGSVTLSDGSTGVSRTIVTGGVPNLYPFWIPYPATSQSSGWRLTVGANQTVTAFGNFT